MRSFVLLPLVLATSCATVSVLPGHGAVALTADGQRSSLPEGVSTVPALLAVDDFDLRQEEQGVTFAALTSDAVPVVVHDAVVAYHLDQSALLAIDRTTGATYRTTVVAPILQSAVGAILATYDYAALDTPHLRDAEARIAARAAAELAPFHILLDGVSLKGVVANLPRLQAAITDSGVWQERSLQAQSEIELARQRAAAQRSVAAGIAAVHRTLAPTLQPTALADAAARAWSQLLVSASTTVQVLPSSPSSTLLEVAP